MAIQIRWDQVEVLPRPEGEKWGISWDTAPFALCIHDHGWHPDKPCYGVNCAVWGLEKDMSVEDAWADYDYADEYEIKEV